MDMAPLPFAFAVTRERLVELATKLDDALSLYIADDKCVNECSHTSDLNPATWQPCDCACAWCQAVRIRTEVTSYLDSDLAHLYP